MTPTTKPEEEVSSACRQSHEQNKRAISEESLTEESGFKIISCSSKFSLKETEFESEEDSDDFEEWETVKIQPGFFISCLRI